MNKSELVSGMALKTSDSKTSTEKALNALIEIISDELKNGGKVQLVGFGTFETRNRAARKGRNPQTGAEMKIPASTSPIFKAGKALKETVNK